MKNPTASAGEVRDKDWIPGSGRSAGEGNDNSLPIFLPGKSHGQRSLVGHSPWGHTELGTTEHAHTHTYIHTHTHTHTHTETEGKKPVNERRFPCVSSFQRFIYSRASLVAQTVKILPAIRETQVQSLGREDLLEEGMASHSNILA